jgi:hypothetical protein
MISRVKILSLILSLLSYFHLVSAEPIKCRSTSSNVEYIIGGAVYNSAESCSKLSTSTSTRRIVDANPSAKTNTDKVYKIQSSTQTLRDDERKVILQSELESEIKILSDLNIQPLPNTNLGQSDFILRKQRILGNITALEKELKQQR